MVTQQKYRISGHESFSCRYTWLPKAVRGLNVNINYSTWVVLGGKADGVVLANDS